MDKTIRVGILRETKTPPDRRVPLTPSQIAKLQAIYPDVEFYVQPSDIRCYNDEEYKTLGITMREDLSNCDILMGVKEVDKSTFIADKTYLFFAHVTKEQPYNRDMFKEIVGKRIKLIDYEYLVEDSGSRVVAFGRWAGIVGAYNGLRALGMKTGKFDLKPAHQCRDLQEMWGLLGKIRLEPGLKILVTGTGRVAGGAMETIAVCNPTQVAPEEYLSGDFNTPVVCQIGPEHYTGRRDGSPFDFEHFVKHPKEYISTFVPYTRVTDLLVPGHFWDPASPEFFSVDDVKSPDFRVSVIADVSCDIDGPIPTTIRATTIADPFYDYNRQTGQEEEAFSDPDNITVMSIDNLPGELPRDASEDFGKQLMSTVLRDLLSGKESGMITRATITEGGKLPARFAYLDGYLKGN